MEQNIFDLINKHQNTTCCFFCYPCTKDIELSLSTVDSDSDSYSDSNSNTTLILYMEKIVLPTNSGNLIAIFFYVCFVLFHMINDFKFVISSTVDRLLKIFDASDTCKDEDWSGIDDDFE